VSIKSNPASPTGWARLIPACGWLLSYDPTWLRGDVVAGLTAAAVVIPQAMAYAAIEGLSWVAGLYTALVRGLPADLFFAQVPRIYASRVIAELT
jgi:MFS superfamily sulfate permease-like transporter